MSVGPPSNLACFCDKQSSGVCRKTRFREGSVKTRCLGRPRRLTQLESVGPIAAAMF